MKKLTVLFTTLFVFAIVFVSWTSPAAEGATITRDQGCVLFDGDGNFVLADSDQTVVTASGNGNLKCSADVGNSTGRAVVQKGFLCNVEGTLTTKSHSVVSASGQSTLTCQVKP